ncbi:hypothetical protein D3C72_1245130 [compost metagenome]
MLLTAVMAQHFTDQARHAPAIHEDVVVGPDQAIAVVLQAHQQQAQQRRTVQREAAFALLEGQLADALRLIIEPAPVQFSEQ